MPKEAFLSAEEIVSYGKDVLTPLFKNFEFQNKLTIHKGIDYLSYEESRLKELSFPAWFLSVNPTRYEYINYIKNEYVYTYIEESDSYNLQITIDKINQNTSVAFPTIILLKEEIKELHYRIRSANSSITLEGNIQLTIENTR